MPFDGSDPQPRRGEPDMPFPSFFQVTRAGLSALAVSTLAAVAAPHLLVPGFAALDGPRLDACWNPPPIWQFGESLAAIVWLTLLGVMLHRAMRRLGLVS